MKRERSKYLRKWFRYVAFPFVWKKSIDEKIIQRKVNFMKAFEDNIDDIVAVDLSLFSPFDIFF